MEVAVSGMKEIRYPDVVFGGDLIDEVEHLGQA